MVFLLNAVVMGQKSTVVAGCLGGREVAERMFGRKDVCIPKKYSNIVFRSTAPVLQLELVNRPTARY
jgi:hypothetical protein